MNPNINSVDPMSPAGAIVLDTESIQLFCVQVCGGDMTIISELVDTYLQSLDNLVSEMEMALQAGDIKLLYRSSHTLKSSSRIFGAEALSANCARLEDLARNGEFRGASTLVKQIVAQSRQMHQLLPAEFQRLSAAPLEFVQ